MLDVNALWNQLANVFLEIVNSLFKVVENIFETKMLQSVVDILKGIGYIMVAVVEMILRVLRMFIN